MLGHGAGLRRWSPLLTDRWTPSLRGATRPAERILIFGDEVPIFTRNGEYKPSFFLGETHMISSISEGNCSRMVLYWYCLKSLRTGVDLRNLRMYSRTEWSIVPGVPPCNSRCVYSYILIWYVIFIPMCHVCTVYMYIMYVYIYIYIYIYIYTYIYICIKMCILYIYICIKMCIYIYICMNMYKYVHVYIYIYMWVNVNSNMYTSWLFTASVVAQLSPCRGLAGCSVWGRSHGAFAVPRPMAVIENGGMKMGV